jgi:hypothetical protein
MLNLLGRIFTPNHYKLVGDENKGTGIGSNSTGSNLSTYSSKLNGNSSNNTHSSGLNGSGLNKNHKHKNHKISSSELNPRLIIFDHADIADKIQICKDIIAEANFSEMDAYDLNYYLKEAASGENPINFDYNSIEDISQPVALNNVIKMIENIYTTAITTIGKKKAIEAFKPAYKDWLYSITNQKNPIHIFPPSESSILLSLSAAFKYLIETKTESNVQSQMYKELGDFFLNSAIHLKDEGKKTESEFVLGITIMHYKNAKVIIPKDIHDNWMQYSLHKTDKLRTDFPAGNKDIANLFADYI